MPKELHEPVMWSLTCMRASSLPTHTYSNKHSLSFPNPLPAAPTDPGRHRLLRRPQRHGRFHRVLYLLHGG
jgi:hypothetical protein